MPTKQKDNVSEWSQCIRCDVIVYAKEMSKHRQECESSKTLSHGHVIGNVLIGVVSLQESKAAIPARQKDHVIFLNTSTMQLCGLCIGGQCIVGKSQTMMVWPCANVNHTSVGLSENTMGKLTCEKGSLLTVEPFIESNQEAEEVSLSIQNGDSERLCADQSLTNYLKKSAMGKYLKIANVLDIGYFGQTLSFIVERIEPKSLNKKLFNIKSDLNNSGLESSFTSLHISDKICPGDSQDLFESSKTSGTHGQKQSYTSTPIRGLSKPGEHNKSELDTSLDKCHFDSSSASERLFDTKVKGEDTSKPDVFQTPVRNIRSTSSPCPSITTDSPVSQTSCTPVSQSSSTPDRSSGTPVSRNSGTPVSRTSDLSVSRNSYFCTPEASRTTRESSSGLFYKVTASTKLCVKSLESIDDKQADISQGVRFTDLGGLTTQIEMLKDFIHLPLRSPEIFKTYGLVQPRGVLIFGPSGCGKSTLVQAVKTELNIHCVTISGPEIWSKFYGETEQKLKSLFNEAKQRSPSLIVIDDIESLCPRRENTNSELEKRVVASFLTLMDGISDKATDKFVMVLGATSKPDSVDPALRRPGRFDKEIEIGVPSAKDRREILQKVLRHCQTDLGVVDVAEVADKAHGYVGADLVALVKEASLHAIKTRAGHDSSLLSINKTDLEYAMDVIQPSAMREVQIEVPKVLWTEIGGQAEIKLKLKQAVEWPLKHPEAFQRMGISPPKGIIMYGPPGCSKTMIAKALATESGLNFLAVKGPELFSKWVGESERAVREVFRKARGAAPSIVFFDEIDALAIERGSSSGGSNVADRVLAQLLTEIDGVEKLKDVTIVAATNRPDMIDKALLRPGRIDRILYVPLPDEDTRREIFRIKMSKMPISEDVSSDWLAEMTDGYTGAEITSICHEAALFALQENINSDCVSRSHFDVALKTVTPRISGSLLTFYENYHRSSGLHTI